MNMADKGQAPLKCVFDRLVRIPRKITFKISIKLKFMQILPFLEKGRNGEAGR